MSSLTALCPPALRLGNAMGEINGAEKGIFDSHAHYDDEKFDGDRDALLSSLLGNEVYAIINCGCDIKSSLKSLELAHTHANVYAAVGIHPHEAEGADDAAFDSLEMLLADEKAVAIGEIGLDYHYDFSPRDVQQHIFERQLTLAERLCKPVIIHDREAHADCVDAVLRHPKAFGVFHSFSGSAETAELLQKNGWYLSFSGSVTFKGNKKGVEAVLATQNDRLLVETDCPYLTPVPHRGKRNDSSFTAFTIAKLAEIRGESYDYIEALTRANAKRLFGI